MAKNQWEKFKTEILETLPEWAREILEKENSKELDLILINAVVNCKE